MSTRSSIAMPGNAEKSSSTRFSETSPPHAICPWHSRYKQAVTRYADMPYSSELLSALADGLLEWASILPQTDTYADGRHKRANSWGLVPELNKIRLIEIILDMRGEARIVEHIKSAVRDLHKAAKALDACYPKLTDDDKAAENRLVPTCSLFALTLADFLRGLRKKLFGPDTDRDGESRHLPSSRLNASPGKDHKPPASRKRAARAANIEALKRELVEHIRSARDYAYAAIHSDNEPQLLPRPSRSEFGRRIGVKPHVVSRCFGDSDANELRLLWQVAGDLPSILRYAR